ncbi:Histidine--tRNA ligase [Forsythia ovata]|uniref:Histidine--tRNA ligase n=1 Tax=Forsythia ovata TaxID=205694 RepID=A0ABD1RZP0_9LAMI
MGGWLFNCWMSGCGGIHNGLGGVKERNHQGSLVAVGEGVGRVYVTVAGDANRGGIRLANDGGQRLIFEVSERRALVELLSKLKQEGSMFLENSESELALNELENLFKSLLKSKCIDKVVFDLSLARGLDYYTGVIFEAAFKRAAPGPTCFQETP